MLLGPQTRSLPQAEPPTKRGPATGWQSSTPAVGVTDRVWTPLVYKAVEICYNDARVACASRQAARDREERIETRALQEEIHEDH